MTHAAAAPVVQVLSVNVGLATPLSVGTRRVLSGIGKRPVAGPVAVGTLGLAGDEQADPSLHGGRDKAVYAYPVAHYTFWQVQRRAHGVSLFDEALPPGFVGENLTIDGLSEAQVWIGDELHFGPLVLRVTEPRQPCFKFAAVMGYPDAPRDMLPGSRCGFYLAVAQTGTLTAGQTGVLVPGRRALPLVEAFAAKRARLAR